MSAVDSNQQLGWLIKGLVDRVPEARSALLSSSDGLVTARTPDLEKDDADQLAAIAASLFSLGKGTGKRFANSEAVRQVIVEVEGLMLFVAAAGFGTCISVLTSEKADPGQIGFEVVQLVRSMRPHLETAPRVDLTAALSQTRS